MDIENKVPIFCTDKNGNLIPFYEAARSATLRNLRKQYFTNNKKEDKHLSTIKFEPNNFDTFKFDDDKKPLNYYIGGTPNLKWWINRYYWCDFNDSLRSSKEICLIIISYLIDRSLNLKNDLLTMHKKNLHYINKIWFSIINDTTYFKTTFPPIPKLLRPYLMKKEDNKENYHIFKEYIKLSYHYRVFII